MAGYGYKPRRVGASQTAVNNRQGLGGITPLGISTRTAAKPAVKPDAVTQALAYRSQGMNQQYGLGAYANAVPGPRAPAQRPAAAPPVNPTLAYDYSADPLLNQIQALSSQGRSDAQANALKLKKQLAIEYGDPALATQFGDPLTAQAAAGNPFGIRQQLAKGYEKGVGQLDEGYNQSNLFYSGARAKGLGNFANQYQGQLAGAAGQQQAALGQIDENLLAALMAADQQDIAGLREAEGRALQPAIDNGIDPGADPVIAALRGGTKPKPKTKPRAQTAVNNRQGLSGLWP